MVFEVVFWRKIGSFCTHLIGLDNILLCLKGHQMKFVLCLLWMVREEWKLDLGLSINAAKNAFLD